MNVALIKRSSALRFDLVRCLFMLAPPEFNSGHALQLPNWGRAWDLPRPTGFQLRGQRSSLEWSWAVRFRDSLCSNNRWLENGNRIRGKIKNAESLIAVFTKSLDCLNTCC